MMPGCVSFTLGEGGRYAGGREVPAFAGGPLESPRWASATATIRPRVTGEPDGGIGDRGTSGITPTEGEEPGARAIAGPAPNPPGITRGDSGPRDCDGGPFAPRRDE